MTRPTTIAVSLSALAGLLFMPALMAGQAADPPRGDAFLSQDEAVMMALRQNPTLEVARRERNVALLDADRAKPGFHPEVIATASQYVRAPRVDLPGKADEVVLPNSVSKLEIGVRQPIYQFGAGSAPATRAQAMAGAARTDYRKAELDTVLEVREAYLSVMRAESMLGVAERAKSLAAANTELTKLLESKGLQATVDVLESQRAESEADSRLLQARNGVDLAAANLNRVLGREIDAQVALQPGDREVLPAEPAPLAELASRAMANRPEAASLRHNIAAAEAGTKLAKAAGLPRVNLEAAYALQTETALVPRSGVAAGVSITLPLFNGVVQRQTVYEAQERLAQLKSALKALEQGITLEVQQQRLAMQEARGRMDVADRTIAAAEKAYDITKARLELGRAIQVEVLNARLNLEKALSDRTAAVADLRIAAARLQRALGEGPTLEEAAPAKGSKS
jgi:outer membrane protein TolC